MGSGSTFVFVSGIGGQSIRNQVRCLPITYPHGLNGEWAKIYTSGQGAKYGALFIEFNVDGDPKKARGYFKNVVGETIDSFTIIADPAGTTSPVPIAPSGLSATAVSPSEIDLMWTDNSGDDQGFKIERSPDGVAGWTEIATVGMDVTTYSDTGLSPLTPYFYRVKAYNSVGGSDYSNVASATTQVSRAPVLLAS